MLRCFGDFGLGGVIHILRFQETAGERKSGGWSMQT